MKQSTRTKPERARAEAEEEFSFSNAVPYADKSEYISKELTFSVVAIEFEPERGYEGADRWAVTVESEDGRGREIVTFGSNEKRDEQMRKAQAYLARHGSIRGVHLRKSGNAYYLDNSLGRRAS